LPKNTAIQTYIDSCLADESALLQEEAGKMN